MCVHTHVNAFMYMEASDQFCVIPQNKTYFVFRDGYYHQPGPYKLGYADWLASQLQGSLCFHLPCSRLKVCITMSFYFMCVVEIEFRL